MDAYCGYSDPPGVFLHSPGILTASRHHNNKPRLWSVWGLFTFVWAVFVWGWHAGKHSFHHWQDYSFTPVFPNQLWKCVRCPAMTQWLLWHISEQRPKQDLKISISVGEWNCKMKSWFLRKVISKENAQHKNHASEIREIKILVMLFVKWLCGYMVVEE